MKTADFKHNYDWPFASAWIRIFRWAKLKLSNARPGDMPVISYDRLMNTGPGHWPNKHRTNSAAAQTKMERSMLNITYKDRKTNIWVRERTKVIDKISNVRKISSPGQSTSTASKTTDGPHVSPYDKIRRQGRSAKRWRRPGQVLERHNMAEDSTR